MSDRKGFRFHQDKAYWFWTIDRPIHSDQVNRFESEFDARIDEILLKPRTKQARLTKKWRDHLISITQDGYGSFRLDFDSELQDRTDAELESFCEDIFELVCSLPIVETISSWINMEEDLSGYLEYSEPLEVMTDYIDAVLDSGYRLKQCDVEEMFGQYFAHTDTIAQEFLVRKLKGQDVVCKPVPEVKESLADCFNLETA